MAYTQRELDELERQGLAVPVVPDYEERAAREARLSALRIEAEREAEEAPRTGVKEVRAVLNHSNAPDPTPDELRARARRIDEERDKADALRLQRLAADREIRDERWPSMVPPEFADAKVEDLPGPLREVCDTWLSIPEGERRNFLLFGPVGVGKTYVSYALARELYIRHHTYLFRSMAGLLDDLRPSGSPEAAMEAAQKADILILDDLGAERKTEWADERFSIIVDHRWQWHLPIIITSNVPLEGLTDMVGERMVSRLVHGATIYKVTGQDLRLT